MSQNGWQPVPGVFLASAGGGIRYRNRDDLVLFALAPGSTTAAVFTRNAFCAAPVTVAREHLAATMPSYLLINAGNANAGTGEVGLRDARETCRLLAAAAGCAINQVLPFSTGVIGEYLPHEPFARAIPDLLQDLSENGWERASRAIMTTDTRPKLTSRQLELQGKQVTLTGMCKGAGMICPNMATMLAFLATDVAMPAARLREALQRAVAVSFNAVTVDGDTSTNDACVLAASGASGVSISDLDGADGRAFQTALTDLCQELARAIILDGEGATKLVEIKVEQARSLDDARAVAYTVAHSPLVKTALFASDPNWGRILAAVGRAGVERLQIDAVRIWLDGVQIVAGGGRDPRYTEAAGRNVLAQKEFCIRIALGMGDADFRLLTCDLSFDYVKINAEYRS